ncbi:MULTISPECIES: hypothetical protein [unclassified Streptomyces]|uniref:hypothetical protein n=1 Tax=unclassified Streptomyces TaxID=2593676 RepID=UPI002E3645E3|nr:hypothetical protein [Streptomyces sp. NBC_01460]WSS30459.1 hypothetical protein OG770_31550 [Streptomyces sp. NBC_01185]
MGISSASAGTAYGSCYTTGASGSVNIANWPYTGSVTGISLKAYDEKPDGHHVRVRLATGNPDGVSWSYFGWHSNTAGYGTYKEWNTYITSVPNGHVGSILLQAATFEGDTLLNYCSSKRLENPEGL